MAEVVDNRKQRKIMVAVDESEESMYALSWALDFLCVGNVQTKDTLILLHAQPLPRVYTATDATGYLFTSDIMQSMVSYQKSITESVLEKAKRICTGKNVCVETRVGVGDARDVTCEEVDKVEPDLLVLGSHGYGAIKRAFLGSVSDYCAHNAKCPVLIVKSPKK
ncbi:universal stress protein A-like protein [Cryptomeria japonica]|uniref:universal stress protein A-like protein n=1 Tax=Cryptomeria japonica TaxID=3369 RepID=UPI0025AD95A8|nr:universal stress protein A-like protein [Cryptomeria japonica]